MDNNKIYLNSDVVEDYISALEKNSYGLETVSNSSKKDFMPLKSNHLYDKGFKKIENCLDKVKNIIDECAHVNKLFITEFFDFEGIMSEKIESELKIPKNFEVDKSFKENLISSVNLIKNDGLSVDNGVETTQVNKTEDYSGILTEKLGDISNNNLQNEQEIDKNTNINRETLSDMNNEVKQEEQSISDVTNIARENLAGINDGVKISNNMDYTNGQISDFQEINIVDPNFNKEFAKVVDDNGIES